MLRRVLRGLNEPTFFWLDRALPTDEAALEGGIFPAYEELELIRSLKPDVSRDLIWVDDIPVVNVDDNPVAAKNWDVELAGSGRFGEKSHTSGLNTFSVLAATHDTALLMTKRLLMLRRKIYEHGSIRGREVRPQGVFAVR